MGYKVQDKSSKTLDAGGAAGAGGDGSLGSLAAQGRSARHREARHGLRTPAPPHLPAAGVLLKSSVWAGFARNTPGPHEPARPPARIEGAAPSGAQSPLPQSSDHSPRTTPMARARPGPASVSLLRPGPCPPPTQQRLPEFGALCFPGLKNHAQEGRSDSAIYCPRALLPPRPRLG
ncbi:unnamed protein product [Rangifer tarandus platyrhynchus]|uniref:Uncharacterized protein n=2 Tax=Rangifer tarandus platyrhynchus TaxID=3082113 RepID=A0ACB0EBK2_RANTA|nr:unnamed protein product [Rangifer tarandus platyrhynchus]CAI9697828.1 unnamed protein product [Rangifer tarandus platyrhynchus]